MERRSKELPTVVRTGLFASSGVAVACVLQPLDVVKIRLQTGMGGYRGASHCALYIIAHEGLSGLYAGTSAALLRHVIHAVAWVTAHSIFISTLTDQQPIGAAQRLLNGRASLANILGFHSQVHWPTPLHEHGLLRGFCYGAIVGAIAAVMSNPTEVALVRMATDGMLRKSRRHNYRHVVDAMRRVRLEEGARALWSGSLHSVVRTVLSLGVSVPFYATMRSSLIAAGLAPDSASLHFYCSAGTGLVSSIVTLPSDFAKTRVQCSDQTKCHTESAVKLLRTMTVPQAIRAVYRGLPPYAGKILLQAGLAATCYDNLANVYRWMTGTSAPSGGGT